MYNLVVRVIREYWISSLLIFIWFWSVFKVDGKKFDIAFRVDLLLVSTILLSLLFVSLWSKKCNKNLKWQLYSLLGFFSFSLLSWKSSEVSSYGLSEILVLGASILAFSSLSVHGKKISKLLIYAFFIGGIISCIKAYHQYFFRPEMRVAGFFYDENVIAHLWPNAFALFLLIITPINIYFLLDKKRIIYLFSLSFLLSSFYLTFSRAAFLVLFGQTLLLLLYLLFRKKYNFKKFLISTISVFVLSSIFVLSANFIREQKFETHSIANKVTFQSSEKKSSINERLDFFGAGLQMMKDKPWLGYGPYSFRYVFPKYQKEFLAHSDHAHNMFIKIGSERGVISLFFLLIFLFFFFWGNLAKVLKGKDRDQATLLLIGVIGAITHNLVDYNFNFIANILLFWMMLGIINSLGQEKKKMDDSFKIAKVGLFIIALIIFCLASREAFYSFKVARNGADLYFAKKYEESYPYFEKYSESFFPRNYFMELGWWSFARDLPELSEKFLLIEANKNRHNAEAWKLLGELESKQKNSEKALAYHKLALENDPMNNFVYYYNVIVFSEKLELYEEINKMLPELEELLINYSSQVKDNLHFTAVRGNNVEYSIKLLSILSRYIKVKKIYYYDLIEEIERNSDLHKQNFENILNYWRDKGFNL